ncbi:MAG: hypothetical protein Q9227_003373 [Pyrenula ochraceoflavens]
MFRQMRTTLSIPPSTDILTHIRTLPTRPARASAVRTIQSIERRFMTSQQPQPGLHALMSYLQQHQQHQSDAVEGGGNGVKMALCTRNFPAPVEHLMGKFLQGVEFEPVVTRETVGVRAKPSPEGVWWCVAKWGVGGSVGERVRERVEREVDREGGGRGSAFVGVVEDGDKHEGEEVKEMEREEEEEEEEEESEEALREKREVLGRGVIMVGDSMDDMEAGYRAGAATVLLLNEENRAVGEHEFTDLCIERLDELVGILENGFVGKG